MRRYSIPPGPIVGAIMMGGLAFTLVGVIVARSPYTHGNLRPEGYDRTEIAYVGEELPFDGIGLADPQLATTGDSAQDGKVLFFGYGCAACHGLKGQGGAVGADIDIDDISRSEFGRDVRKGPKGMPSFMEETLNDEDLDKLYAFLESVAQEPSEEAAAGIIEIETNP
jgi:mono/diheme cytochrome c family protein